MKWLYHHFLSLVLNLVGLDFSWYQTFYVRVVYALPFVEPFLQVVRTSKRAKSILGVPDALRFAKPGDIVLDLGANVGSISSLFLSMGFTVHAYEPDSRCIALLRRRFKWIGQGRIYIHHCAVSGAAGTATLNYGSLTTESNSIISNKPGADGSSGGEVVIIQGILEILEQHGYVPLIKMDIEGAEYDVLEALLHPCCLDLFGVCLVEVHAKKIPGLMPRQRKLEEKIVELGLNSRVLLTWH